MTELHFSCRHHYADGFELDVSFETDALVTSLFGPSGSGKTSVLSMIAGLLQPQQGAVRFNGRTLMETAGSLNVPIQKRRVGMVFQEHRLFPHLSVEGNLLYGFRRSRGEERIPFRRVVEILELEELLQRRPETLSGGERQRVALGRALLSGPELLLLDEPLAALDESLKHRILTYVERVVGEWELPTLFVSHDQSEVRRLADWTVVLEKGNVVTEGVPQEALGTPGPLSWKESLGPVNLLRIGEVQQNNDRWMGRVGDQMLHLPKLPTAPPTPLFVQFSPNAVLLSRRDVDDLSARNHLQGVVRQIVELPSGTFVAVDTGQILWALVTPEAVKELQLETGCKVICLIKTHSLKILD